MLWLPCWQNAKRRVYKPADDKGKVVKTSSASSHSRPKLGMILFHYFYTLLIFTVYFLYLYCFESVPFVDHLVRSCIWLRYTWCLVWSIDGLCDQYIEISYSHCVLSSSHASTIRSEIECFQLLPQSLEQSANRRQQHVHFKPSQVIWRHVCSLGPTVVIRIISYYCFIIVIIIF